MEFFVYFWEYKYSIIYAHSLDDKGKYILLGIQNYMPSCCVEGEVFPGNKIIPAKIERVNMATSLDVCNKRAYHRAWFKN